MEALQLLARMFSQMDKRKVSSQHFLSLRKSEMHWLSLQLLLGLLVQLNYLTVSQGRRSRINR